MEDSKIFNIQDIINPWVQLIIDFVIDLQALPNRHRIVQKLVYWIFDNNDSTIFTLPDYIGNILANLDMFKTSKSGSDKDNNVGGMRECYCLMCFLNGIVMVIE